MPSSAWNAAVQGDATEQWRLGAYGRRLYVSGLRHAAQILVARGASDTYAPAIADQERFAALSLVSVVIKACALHPEWAAGLAGKLPLNTIQAESSADAFYEACSGALADLET